MHIDDDGNSAVRTRYLLALHHTVLQSRTEDQLRCLVYVAVNRVNGHIYIGATDSGIKTRRYKHFWNARNGQKSKFYTAVRKHGEAQFYFLIIAECREFVEALKREEDAIRDLLPEYNLTRGGGGIKGYKFSAETIAHLASLRRGRKGAPCPEWLKKKNAELRRADKGKPVSEHRKAKMRENAKKAQESVKRPVVCVTDGRVYASLTEAAKEYGLTTGQITYHCKGNHRSRRGLQFRYAEQLPWQPVEPTLFRQASPT